VTQGLGVLLVFWEDLGMPSGTAQPSGPLAVAVCAIIRDRMISAGISQRELASLISVSKSQVSKLLRAKAPISLDQVDRLVVSVGLDLESVIADASRSALDRKSEWQSICAKEVSIDAAEVVARRVLDESGETAAEFARKIRLLAESLRPRMDDFDLYAAVWARCNSAGVLLSAREWEAAILGREDLRIRKPQSILPIASFFGVSVDYLRHDDERRDDEIEADLQFDRAMYDVGVQRVAARSEGEIPSHEVREIAVSVTRVVEALRSKRSSAN
jgi:transcriptional regulator with XRE-family HTH domain